MTTTDGLHTSDPQIRSHHSMATHMAAEYTNDIDKIISTISDPPRYALIRRGEPLTTFEDASGPRMLYTEWRTTYDCLNSRQTRQITSDWYIFEEAVTFFRHKGDFEGTDRTGVEYVIPYAVFTPVKEAGKIIGEFVWGRRSVPDAIRASINGTPLPDDRVFGAIERLDLHDRIVDALRKGATAELGSLYAADASFAVRDPADDQGRFHQATGPAEIAAFYTALLGDRPPLQVEVIQLVATDWYVFAEHRLTLDTDAGPADLRTASIYAFDDDGRLVAQIGYGPEPR
jgi:hypothetical protein